MQSTPLCSLSSLCTLCALYSGYRFNRYCGTVETATLEHYCTIYQCIKCIILTDAHVLAWIVLRATLADDDVTSLSKLATKEFYSKSF